MFIAIQGNEYDYYRPILERMHRLRKRVFYDQLKWDVPAQGEIERDRYDDFGPVYLNWFSPDQTKLYASIRLMPTTGPTLLFDLFQRTMPDGAGLSAPGIWEGTRACIDHEALAQDHPHITPLKAFGLISLATAECAFHHGIDTVVTNYEPYLARAYCKAGAPLEEIGRADGYGRYPVCCGIFEISRKTLTTMRAKLGVTTAYSKFAAEGLLKSAA